MAPKRQVNTDLKAGSVKYLYTQKKAPIFKLHISELKTFHFNTDRLLGIHIYSVVAGRRQFLDLAVYRRLNVYCSGSLTPPQKHIAD